MASIAMPGIQTGIDTAAIVEQLLLVARRPVAMLETRRDLWQARVDALDTLETRLSAVQDAAEALRTTGAIAEYATASTDETVLTASAGSGAGEGAHTVVINRLAAGDRKIHDGLASADALVGAGRLAFTYDGQTYTIDTDAETTLEDLRDVINHSAAGNAVTASLLEYDAGGGQAVHLVLAGNDTGADYAVTVEDGQTTLAGFTSDTFTTTQAAQDAQIRIDGYPDGAWITRSTNTVDDVLPGVTLSLHATGEARLSLTRDTEALKGKLSDLVDAYNAVVSYARDRTAWDETTETAGILMGEFAVSHVRTTLRTPFIETATGFLGGSDPFSLAADLGLSTDGQGRLELDEEALDEALDENYLAVLALLGADRTGDSDSADITFYAAATQTTPGTYDVEAVFDAGTLVSARFKLASEGAGAWRDATVDGTRIRGTVGQAEQGLYLNATYGGTGTLTAQVRVRQGIGGRLYDLCEALLDPTDGTLAMTGDRYQGTIDSIEDSIERQEDRLTREEARLRAKFARLETALTLLEAQRSAIAMG